MSLVFPDGSRTVPLATPPREMDHGEKIRRMLGHRPPNAAMPPHLDKPIWIRQPDGSYGTAPAAAPSPKPRPSQPQHVEGRTWLPGYGYVPSDSPVVQQINQNMELERDRMELEREKLAMERDRMEREFAVAPELRAWLTRRLGGAG